MTADSESKPDFSDHDDLGGSMTSSSRIRMQPDDTLVPMVHGSF